MDPEVTYADIEIAEKTVFGYEEKIQDENLSDVKPTVDVLKKSNDVASDLSENIRVCFYLF